MIEFTVDILAKTPKAIMIGNEHIDESDEVWLPLSGLDFEVGYKPKVDDEDVIVLIPEALALKKGLL